MENEIMDMQNEEVVMTNEETEENKGFGTIGKIVAGIVIAGLGAGAIIYKNRDKFDERKARRLEKKGYVVYRPDEVQNDIVEVEDDEEE